MGRKVTTRPKNVVAALVPEGEVKPKVESVGKMQAAVEVVEPPVVVMEPPKEPERVLPLVKVEVFASARMRKDQSAGFVFWVNLHKLGPMTIPQWQEEFEKYGRRPV